MWKKIFLALTIISIIANIAKWFFNDMNEYYLLIGILSLILYISLRDEYENKDEFYY